MNDGDALLAAILADPADDTARLVYADWLNENPEVACPKCKGNQIVSWDGIGPARTAMLCPTCHGAGTIRDDNRDDRAEFIRTQVKIQAEYPHHAENGHDHTECPACILIRRTKELFTRHCREWFPNPTYHDWKWLIPGDKWSLPDETWSGLGLCHFRRGFVEDVACTPVDWIRHADAWAWSKYLPRPCGYCRDGIHDWDTNVIECQHCDSTGFVEELNPMPVPLTAHPIRRVRWTATISAEVCNSLRSWAYPLERSGNIRDTIANEWPWIEFDISSATPRAAT